MAAKAPAKSKGGRPAHRPTVATRRRVSIAAGSGSMTLEEIAIGVGITVPTLRKHYEAELSEVAYRRRLDVLEAQFKAAMKGKIAAQKAYLEGTPHAAVPPDSPPDPPVAEKPLGKKAQAQEDAKGAAVGTDWAHLLDGATPATAQ